MEWPAGVIALGVIAAATLPGAMYAWGLQQQVRANAGALAGWSLRILPISALFHLVFGWGEYWVWRVEFDGHPFGGGQFAALWALVAVLGFVPAVLGTVVGGLYATRSTRQGWSRVRRVVGGHEGILLRLAVGRALAEGPVDGTVSDQPSTHGTPKVGLQRGGVFRRYSGSGGYRGRSPASEVAPPKRIPSQSIRPRPDRKQPAKPSEMGE